MITLELPFPPSVNHYWRKGRNVTYISKEGQHFIQDVAAIVTRAFLANDWQPWGEDVRLNVALVLHAPTRRKYDIDNRIKATLDALVKAGLFEDDEQVDTLGVSRGEYRKNAGCCYVTITPVAA